MEFKGRLTDVAREWGTGKARITFEVIEMESGVLESAVEAIRDTDLRVNAVRYFKKRSLNANAYAWVLMQKLAEAVHSSKDEIYLEMLRRYSRRFHYCIVQEKALDDFKKAFRLIEEVGEISVGSGKGIQICVYDGSSNFDSKDMAVFIDGIVSECKELGIETLPPRELERMKKAWAKVY